MHCPLCKLEATTEANEYSITFFGKCLGCKNAKRVVKQVQNQRREEINRNFLYTGNLPP